MNGRFENILNEITQRLKIDSDAISLRHIPIIFSELIPKSILDSTPYVEQTLHDYLLRLSLLMEKETAINRGVSAARIARDIRRKRFDVIDLERLFNFMVTYTHPDINYFSECSRSDMIRTLGIPLAKFDTYRKEAAKENIRFEVRNTPQCVFNEIDQGIFEVMKKTGASIGWDAPFSSWPVTRFIKKVATGLRKNYSPTLSCEGKLSYPEYSDLEAPNVHWVDVYTSSIRLKITDAPEEADSADSDEENAEVVSPCYLMRLKVVSGKKGRVYRGDYYYLYDMGESGRGTVEFSAKYDEERELLQLEGFCRDIGKTGKAGKKERMNLEIGPRNPSPIHSIPTLSALKAGRW